VLKPLNIWALALCLLTAAATAAPAQQCADFAESRCQIRIEPHRSFIKKTDVPISRVSIADPEIADVQLITPTQVLVVARKNPGSTNLVLWHGDDHAEVYDVQVFLPGDLVRLIEERIQQLAPDARVSLAPGPKGVILHGEVESQETLERVLKTVQNHVDNTTNLVVVRGSQQVQLEVKIAEVSRSGMKKMGLGFLSNRDWTIGLFPAGTALGEASSAKSALSGAPAVVDRSLGALTEVGTPFASAFQVVAASMNDDFLALLSVLKGQNLARFLARPTLVTMNGQEANFLVGGEFPYPVTGELGQTNIEFKNFGIMLRFTPYVVGRETITLKIEPEVSNIDRSLTVFSGGTAVPGLKTRRGSTTLQLKDGQTFVMAGLLKEDSATVVNKVPLLGDIPVLGTLFTSKEFQKEESELMVIVTPRLVRALNPDQVPELPGERFNDNVGDLDFFLRNRAMPRSGQPGDDNTATLKDPGFVGGYGFAR
jgi:pilus assembly protein CpaC